MTSTTRRSIAGAALAFGMLLGSGVATANADVLDSLSDQYGSGAGGGQVVNLLDDALTLRNRGIPPTAADQAAIQAAMDKRPNLGPLVDALRATVAQQRQTLSRGSVSGGGGSQGGAQQPWAPIAGDNGNNALIPGGWGTELNPWG